MNASEPARVPAAKRPYQAPRLIVHGTVAELTLKIGTNNDVDQGGSFNPGTN